MEGVGHLAVLVVHPERDAGTGQQQQGLLLRQLLLQTFDDFGSLVGSLESGNWAENTFSFCGTHMERQLVTYLLSLDLAAEV